MHESSPRELVYSVMRGLLPGIAFNDATELDAIGYDDSASKDIIRAAINKRHWHGVNLPFNALGGCSVISDITGVVSEAEA
jgi:hypothetical protein